MFAEDFPVKGTTKVFGLHKALQFMVLLPQPNLARTGMVHSRE